MDESVVNAGAALGVVRRQWRLIAAAVVVGMGLAAGFLFTQKPVYSATALVMVDPSRKDLLNPQAQLGAGWDSNRVDSELELVASGPVLLEVVDEVGLLSNPEFGPTLGWRDWIASLLKISQPPEPTGDELLSTAVSQLYNAISVKRLGFTYLIAISARSINPETASRIANAVAENYIKEQVASKVRALQSSRDIVQTQATKASEQLVQAEDTLNNFLSDSIESIARSTGRTDLLAMQRQLDAANEQRLRDLGIIQTAEADVSAGNWQTIADTLKSQALDVLAAQRAALQGRIDGADEAVSVDLRKQLAGIDSQLKRAAQTEIETLKKQVNDGQSTINDLREKLRSEVAAADLPADVLTDLYSLQQAAAVARTQYQSLLSRSAELDAQSYLQVPDSRVVADATPPSKPAFPSPTLVLGVGGLLSLGLGLGLAFLVENYVGGYTSEDQLSAGLGLPVIAAVPRQTLSPDVNDALIDAPLAAYGESLRRIRLGIDLATRRTTVPQGRARVTVVATTSTLASEGKTTLALGLARTYALAGQKALVVDTDLRRPSIHRQSHTEGKHSLLDYLKGQVVDFEELLVPDYVDGVQLIASSERSEVATDRLLAGPAFADLIARARMRFDVIILDTAPVQLVVDPLYVAAMADVNLFVVRWAFAPQREVRTAAASIAAVAGPDKPLLGVLNQTPMRGNRRYHYTTY